MKLFTTGAAVKMIRLSFRPKVMFCVEGDPVIAVLSVTVLVPLRLSTMPETVVFAPMFVPLTESPGVILPALIVESVIVVPGPPAVTPKTCGSDSWTKFPVAPATRAARLPKVITALASGVCANECTVPSPALNVSVLSAMLAPGLPGVSA